MHSLVEIRGAEDDWTGLGDAKLRRKLQNRLNVRAHRKRKLLAEKARKTGGSAGGASDAISNHDALSFAAPASAPLATTASRHQTYIQTRPGTWGSSSSSSALVSVARTSNSDDASKRVFPDMEPCKLTLAAQALLDLSQMPDRPRPVREFVFKLPLSSDHLIIVVQFNVLRGLLSNMAALRRMEELRARYPEKAPPLFPGPSCSPLSSPDYSSSSSSSLSPPSADDRDCHLSAVPAELLPTPLQRSTLHGEWIDYCPSGTMRDNLVRHEQAFDHEQLLRDILGSVCDSGPGGEEGCGLIVWQDPWSPWGWELTEGFARKWSFLVEGCDELLASTNRWRASRGEEPLVIEL
ncbi:uncharacterized protein B0I36DRAFT_35422 [Microdochium trichocladiopsis]|uniref:BZIP domain-containing protein n=1 Tax=Microdochium trichocladiopsis TaxID=1682393 RepID=A0A9P8XVF0_9PEZI|nr:uncharacterized protein B0I36DRAFT_35422 [Microdochium trichocladiopsis]KAH7018051.1 hypothetical protein B0I36DRAFT_35422 [Microdochium trichocladiopsis]